MKALVIQHDHVSPLGPIGEQLTARGYDLQTCGVVPSDRFDEPNVEWKAPSMLDFDLVVLMGSPWAVYDHDRIGAWVKPELDELRRADRAGTPVLGICWYARARHLLWRAGAGSGPRGHGRSGTGARVGVDPLPR